MPAHGQGLASLVGNANHPSHPVTPMVGFIAAEEQNLSRVRCCSIEGERLVGHEDQRAFSHHQSIDSSLLQRVQDTYATPRVREYRYKVQPVRLR